LISLYYCFTEMDIYRIESSDLYAGVGRPTEEAGENTPFRPTGPEEEQSTSKRLRQHVVVAALASAASIAVWVLSSLLWKQYPWFVFPLGFFGTSLAIHYYLFRTPKRDYLALHMTLFAIINSLLLLVWCFQQVKYETWFMYPLGCTAILLVVHYYFEQRTTNPEAFLTGHICVFAIITTLSFGKYLDSEKETQVPWFIFIFFGLGAILSVHYNLHFHPKNLLRVHVFLFANAQLLFFFSVGL